MKSARSQASLDFWVKKTNASADNSKKINSDMCVHGTQCIMLMLGYIKT